MRPPINTFSESTIFVMVFLSIFAVQCHGSQSQDSDTNGSNVCSVMSSVVTGFYASVRGPYSYPIREQFLLQNLGSDDDQCMRTTNASLDDYATVGLVSCDDTEPTQIIKISYTDGDSSVIDLPPIGKSLTLDTDSYGESTPVYQYVQMYSLAQLWSFNYASDNTRFQLVNQWSGQCLTGYSDHMTTTDCADLSDIDYVPKNQLWRKLPSQVTLVGHLVNKLTSKCLHADNAIPNSDFADVDLKECDVSDHSQIITFQAGITYQVGQTITFSTGKVLSEVSIINYVKVQQMTNSNYTNQFWQPSAIINDWFQLQTSLWPGYCLSVRADGNSMDTQPCGWDLEAQPELFWKFVIDSDC